MNEKSNESDEYIEGRLAGCQLASVILALALTEERPVSRERMLERLLLMEVFATITESQAAGRSLRHIREMFKALSSQDIAPENALLSLIALHVDAGPDRREALRTWLQVASNAEIGDDVLQALRAFVARGDGSGEA